MCNNWNFKINFDSRKPKLNSTPDQDTGQKVFYDILEFYSMLVLVSWLSVKNMSSPEQVNNGNWHKTKGWVFDLKFWK